MKSSDMKELGFPPGLCCTLALKAYGYLRNVAVMNHEKSLYVIKEILRIPESYSRDGFPPPLSRLAQEIISTPEPFKERETPAPLKQWGVDLDPASIEQVVNACRLPISRRAALMPDAHLGYGLPIGGVLECDNAVIPYAVGMDIACRVSMTVFDGDVNELENRKGLFSQILEDETRFGIGARFKSGNTRQHEVMDNPLWGSMPLLKKLKDIAYAQLGSSGSGNHFVEFGILNAESEDNGFNLLPGKYIALFSHSGSRGAGSNVAKHYSQIATDINPSLPDELKHLAWLPIDSEPGQEYWLAMNLMGDYASANHACIHKAISKALNKSIGLSVLGNVENHHNFAWEEDGYIVHRKGATPAHAGTVGIIPGTMCDETYVVRGLGNKDSINSSSHGAGRRMSRKKAKKEFTNKDLQKVLKENNVTLISGGLDESPMAYKTIGEVMSNQSDLVETLATFKPRIVKMAPSGEPAED